MTKNKNLLLLERTLIFKTVFIFHYRPTSYFITLSENYKVRKKFLKLTQSTGSQTCDAGIL